MCLRVEFTLYKYTRINILKIRRWKLFTTVHYQKLMTGCNIRVNKLHWNTLRYQMFLMSEHHLKSLVLCVLSLAFWSFQDNDLHIIFSMEVGLFLLKYKGSKLQYEQFYQQCFLVDGRWAMQHLDIFSESTARRRWLGIILRKELLEDLVNLFSQMPGEHKWKLQ